jgi:hypothetical protein
MNANPTKGGGQEPGMLSTITDFFASLPPITRVLVTSSLVLPIVLNFIPSVYLYTTLTRLSDGSLAPLQPWRLFSHFFIQGIAHVWRGFMGRNIVGSFVPVVVYLQALLSI